MVIPRYAYKGPFSGRPSAMAGMIARDSAGVNDGGEGRINTAKTRLVCETGARRP